MKGFIANDLPIPTYQDVFDLLQEEDIFAYYVPGLTLNSNCNSPIGERDEHPSFSVFWSYRKLKYLFKDFRYGYTGDCVDLVRYIYGYKTNTEACMKIFKDFGVNDFYINSNISGSSGQHTIVKPIFKRTKRIQIKVKVREWKNYDITYWTKYGISEEILFASDVYPISHYFLNGAIRIADKYAYAYIERKDEKITYKIYQPFNKVGIKWRSNNDLSVWELWNLLPQTHDFLIITKSRKDAMSIISTLKIPATALQAEGTIPKDQVIDELKGRFKKIYMFYDNDYDGTKNWGQLYAKKLSQTFNIPNLYIPESYQAKDYTDFIIKYSIQKGRNLLWNLIKREIINNKRDDNKKRNNT